MSTPPDNLAPIPEGNTKLTDLLEGRVPHLISSFEGTGQYSQGASSGCGLAALNAVRVVLGREKAGLKGLALLLYLGGKDIIDVSSLYPSCLLHVYVLNRKSSPSVPNGPISFTWKLSK